MRALYLLLVILSGLNHHNLETSLIKFWVPCPQLFSYFFSQVFLNIPFFLTGTMAKRKSVHKVDNLKNSPFKTLLVIGKTGTGKSALCNKIAGLHFDTNEFPVSADPTSCTQNTVLANVNFNGDQERPISLIDTMGFDDPDSDTDITIIAELVTTLKNNCSNVNLFGIAVNGQSPRLDGSLVAMIKIFEEMFGDDFWRQCVIIFTRMPMNEKEKERRLKASRKSDNDFARDYVCEVTNKFPRASQSLRHVFMDVAFDEKDASETGAFREAMEEVYEMIDKAPNLPTSSVKENVHTENYKLKEKLSVSEKRYNELAQEKQRQKGTQNYWKTMIFTGLGSLAGSYPGGVAGAAVGYVLDNLF